MAARARQVVIGPGFAQPLKCVSKDLSTPNVQLPTPNSQEYIDSMSTLADRLLTFVVERYPFALPAAQRALESCGLTHAADQKSIEDLRPRFCQALAKSLGDISVNGLPDTTPGTAATTRLQSARDELVAACDGFLLREAIRDLADRRRAPRDPARHGADARHRQPAEAVFSRAARSDSTACRFREKVSGRSDRRPFTLPASG